MTPSCTVRAARGAAAVGLLTLVAAACSDPGPINNDVPVADYTPPRDTGRDAGGGGLDAAPDVPSVPDADATAAQDVRADGPDAALDARPDAALDAPRADAPAGDSVAPDSGPSDSAPSDTGPRDGALADAPAPYRHGWTIDGTRDALPAETFATTTAGYTAYYSWDAANLYAGYEGADLGAGAADRATKWVLIYLDVDPGSGIGATDGEQYNTQRPHFPTGFRPDYYFRWKADDTLRGLRHFDGTAWADVAVSVPQGRGTNFAEWSIPLSALGSPGRVLVTSFMLNERAFAEFTYAGLYTGNFTDGYYGVTASPPMPIPISAWLDADFASALVPNDPGRRRP